MLAEMSQQQPKQTRWNEECQQCGQACHYTGATWIDGRRLCKNCRLELFDRLKEVDELMGLLAQSGITLRQLIQEWSNVVRVVNQHNSFKEEFDEIQTNNF